MDGRIWGKVSQGSKRKPHDSDRKKNTKTIFLSPTRSSKGDLTYLPLYSSSSRDLVQILGDTTARVGSDMLNEMQVRANNAGEKCGWHIERAPSDGQASSRVATASHAVLNIIDRGID